jgi:hypothetical protein
MDEYPPEDDALAANMAIEGVRHCLDVCGITTPLAQNAIIAEGFTDIMSFSEIRDKDVHETVKTINTIPIANPAMMAAPNHRLYPLGEGDAVGAQGDFKLGKYPHQKQTYGTNRYHHQ